MSCREINFSISFLSFLIFSLHCHVFAVEKSHLKVQQIFLAGMGNREAGTHNPITFLFPAPHSNIFLWHKPDALSLSASIKLWVHGVGLTCWIPQVPWAVSGWHISTLGWKLRVQGSSALLHTSPCAPQPLLASQAQPELRCGNATCTTTG